MLSLFLPFFYYLLQILLCGAASEHTQPDHRCPSITRPLGKAKSDNIVPLLHSSDYTLLKQSTHSLFKTYTILDYRVTALLSMAVHSNLPYPPSPHDSPCRYHYKKICRFEISDHYMAMEAVPSTKLQRGLQQPCIHLRSVTIGAPRRLHVAILNTLQEQVASKPQHTPQYNHRHHLRLTDYGLPSKYHRQLLSKQLTATG